MALRFHLDEDTEEHALVLALRERGLDVKTCGESNLRSAGDNEQLCAAAKDCRVLVSYNIADFCRIHKELLQRDEHHAGIVLIQQQRLSVGEIVARLLRLAAALEAHEMNDRVEFLSHW